MRQKRLISVWPVAGSKFTVRAIAPILLALVLAVEPAFSEQHLQPSGGSLFQRLPPADQARIRRVIELKQTQLENLSNRYQDLARDVRRMLSTSADMREAAAGLTTIATSFGSKAGECGQLETQLYDLQADPLATDGAVRRYANEIDQCYRDLDAISTEAKEMKAVIGEYRSISDQLKREADQLEGLIDTLYDAQQKLTTELRQLNQTFNLSPEAESQEVIESTEDKG